MSTQILYPNSDIAQPATPGKSGGTYYYENVDDASAADYLWHSGLTHGYWEFGVQAPTAVGSSVPTSIELNVGVNNNEAASRLSTEKYCFADISIDGGTTWLRNAALLYQFPDTFDASTAYYSGYVATSLPAGTTWASITDIHVRLWFNSPTKDDHSWTVSSTRAVFHSLRVKVSDTHTWALTESADVLAVAVAGEYGVDNPLVTSAGAGSVVLRGILRNCYPATPDITLKRAQLAHDIAFTDIIADSSDVVATSGHAGDEVVVVVTSVDPGAVALLHARVGIGSTAFPTLRYASCSTAVFYPSITSTSIAQSGSVFTWTVVIADTYVHPPTVMVIVDGVAYDAALTATGAGTFTYKAVLTLGRGKHFWRLQVSNVWQQLNTDEQQMFAEYAPSTPGIELYVDNTRIEGWDITLTEAVLPELPTLAFTSATWIAGHQTVKAVCSLRGIKTYSFSRRYATKQGDGTWAYQCEASEQDIFDEVATMRVNALSVEDGVKQAIGSLRLADDYGLLMPGLIHETTWQDVPRSAILDQLLVQAGLNAWCRNGLLYCQYRDVSTLTPRLSVRQSDVRTAYQEDARTYNWVRVWYAIKQYPVVETALTDYDAAQWTGTVDNALRNGSGLLPASGSNYCLKGTGAITRAGLSANISDFDRIKLRWCPPTGTTSLSITLQTDSSNKYVATRIFSGGTGAGFNLTGASASDATLTKTITLGIQRIVSVTGEMTKPCSVTVTLKSQGTTVWTSNATQTSGANNTFAVNAPYSQTSATADSMELAFTNLYAVSNSYGVSCVELTIEEYKQTTVVTGSSSRVIASYTKSFSLPMQRSAGVVSFGRASIGAVPTVSGDQSWGVSQSGGVWGIIIISATEEQATQLGGIYVDEENGMLYATAGDIALGTEPGDVRSVSSASGSATVKTFETTYTTVQVWVVSSYAWQSSYNLWDEVDLPLSSFAQTGSPTTLNSIILSATGINYYDGLMLYCNQPKERYVDAKSGDGLHKMPDRTGDGFGSENGARLFAEGLLALASVAVKDYSVQLPLDTDIGLGDPIDCDGEVLAVYGITYDFTGGYMTVKVGKRVQEMLEMLRNHAERIDRLENHR